jgi:hypothetical protein
MLMEKASACIVLPHVIGGIRDGETGILKVGLCRLDTARLELWRERSKL